MKYEGIQLWLFWWKCSHLLDSDVFVGELIGAGCFAGCPNLSRVTFDAASTLSRIGESAFSGYSLGIPSSVETLCDRCDSSCSQLSTVTFDPGSRLMTFVDESGFAECSSLSSIWIPSSVQALSEFPLVC
jgi:hypothetical protein